MSQVQPTNGHFIGKHGKHKKRCPMSLVPRERWNGIMMRQYIIYIPTRVTRIKTMMRWNGFLTPPSAGRGVSGQRPPNRGPPRPPLWFHLPQTPASPVSSCPTSPLSVPQSLAIRNGLNTQGGYRRRGEGLEGSSAHSNPLARGSPAGLWGRKEIALCYFALATLPGPFLYPTADHSE